jgi:CHAD domain-containing protein
VAFVSDGSALIDPELGRARSHELSEEPQRGTPEENWLAAERELTIVHDYDTLDRDLERCGMTVSRVPLEAGAVWRLQLPRGERIQAWEPGNNGLAPPAEIAQLIASVIAQKQLVPMPPASADPGAARLREMIEAQRLALVRHDPGTRLGVDSENLHQHRVAARRIRAFLRATRGYVDPAWRRSLDGPLRELGAVTGALRDLDVLLEHVRAELEELGDDDRAGADTLVAQLTTEREAVRHALLQGLDGDSYRLVLARLRLPPRLAADVETLPLARIARKQFRRVIKAIERLGENPDDAAVHELRIALKRARYAAELSAPGGRGRDRFLAHARTLQDLLGQYQDAVVTERRLREAGVVDPTTAAAFVAGRLAERQRARRRKVTERLPAAWKRLSKSGAQLR